MAKNFITTAGVVFVLAASPLLGQQFVNGSLTGGVQNGAGLGATPTVNNGLPPGWSLIQGSPDTNDPFNNAGLPVASSPFAATPSYSPDGGTWVGLGKNNPQGFVEAFGQSLSGLTIGNTYTVSWYASNFGSPQSYNYVNPNFFELLLNGTSVGAGPTLALGPGWFAQSATFVAASTTDAIGFRLGASGPSYMGIDGVSLVGGSSTVVTPEPATFALLGAGIALIGVARRKRSA